MPTATRRLRSVIPRLRWYGLAVALSALALILMLLLRPLMEPSIFFLFLAAVAVSAMYGGLGPGLVATLLSALAANFFFLAPNHALLGETEHRAKAELTSRTLVQGISHSFCVELEKKPRPLL